MSDVEKIVSEIGWIEIGSTDDSNKINRAIDMLRAQARRIVELEGVRDIYKAERNLASKGLLESSRRFVELQAQLDRATKTIAAFEAAARGLRRSIRDDAKACGKVALAALYKLVPE